MPVCACQFAGLSSPLPAAPSTGIPRDNGRVNREQPDIADLGNDVFQVDTRAAERQGSTAEAAGWAESAETLLAGSLESAVSALAVVCGLLEHGLGPGVKTGGR